MVSRKVCCGVVGEERALKKDTDPASSANAAVGMELCGKVSANEEEKERFTRYR